MTVSTAPATSYTEGSTHPYAGLDTPDANPATWIDYDTVGDTEDFESKTDWLKTHKRTYFQYLDELNRGVVNGIRRNSPYYTYEKNQHKVEIMASQLELTDRQRSLAEKWTRRIDFQELGVNIEIVIFSICMYLVHEDKGDEREWYPQMDMDEWPSAFVRMFEDGLHERERSMIASVYGKVSYRIRKWTSQSEPASKPMDKFGMLNRSEIE